MPLKAVTRQASLVDSKLAAINNQNSQVRKSKISTAYFFDHYATKEDVAVLVEEEDFIKAEKELVPSVSVKELDHYKRVRAQFEKAEDKNEEEKARASASQHDGIPQWQQESAKSNGKGKGKAVDRKGKGKAVGVWDEEDDDEFYSGGGMPNGRDKGKGKAIDMGFQADDEELY
jgi:peroxin-6